jgi:hypothetical protein
MYARDVQSNYEYIHGSFNNMEKKDNCRAVGVSHHP